MAVKQILHMLALTLVVMVMVTVVCCEEHQGSELEDSAPSQPQKRSVDPQGDIVYPAEALYLGSDDMDKRSSLFRFGKRGSLFRFGKRGSLFRFGKRGSLFRFGKRGSLFRFGKRQGGDEGMEEEGLEMYPELPEDFRVYQFGPESQ